MSLADDDLKSAESLFIVAPIVCLVFFSNIVLCVLSSFAITVNQESVAVTIFHVSMNIFGHKLLYYHIHIISVSKSAKTNLL